MAPSTNLRRGISLIEILIAIAFLTFGLAGVTDMYVTQMQQAARTRQQQTANATAASMLTELQAAGFAALDAKLAAQREVDLFPKPAPSTNANVLWNAHLKKEQKDGVNRIHIAVTATWALADAGKSASIRKEAIGYVAAP